MKTAMESIKDMVDVNTIVGDAVHASDGSVIIPVSKVCFGFAAGGGEYHDRHSDKEDKDRFDDESQENTSASKFPFAGGSGAGVSIVPMAFLVVGQGQVRLLHLDANTSIEKIIDLIPELLQKAREGFRKKVINRKPAAANNEEYDDDLTEE